VTKKNLKEKLEASKKDRGLFDHVKHIRQVQSPDYISTLSEKELKTFNHYMILKALSMDSNLIEFVAEIYPYFDKIPTPAFYKMLIEVVPKSMRFYPWVKRKSIKYNTELLELLATKFEISKRQAVDYCNVFLADENGINKLVDICKGFGLEDNEVEKLFEEKTNEK
jgi:hypothetical protein